ncbi:hypothetical protein TZ02_03370 [Clostridium aceticum]|nr:hypothetical protein TZ02_03370 [Clostridium aceticum]
MEAFRYQYSSVLAPYIEGLIRQKKADGFIYDYQSYILKTFDDFCLNRGYKNAVITRDVAMEWAVQRKTEGLNYRNQRVSFLRQLSLYMNSMGINSYIPHHMPSEKVSVPHIFNREELQAFFEVVDTYLPENERWHCLAMEYQLLFRLYYCCGLRLSEGCGLEKKDVDLTNGILDIRQSKGRKDRQVYMADDLIELCRKYQAKMNWMQPNTVWFFPGRTPDKHIQKTSIDKKFKQLWEMTSYSKHCDKQPTVHAFRHTFVVNRINHWMVEGVSLENMMPYLSRYLGHSGIEDTMYYYHQVHTAFEIVRQKDQISAKVIPEVMPYEE